MTTVTFNALLRIAPHQLQRDWRNFSRQAYVEPVVIVDGFHSYVLMSVDDYKALSENAAETVVTPT